MRIKIKQPNREKSKRPERFIEEDIQLTHKHMKRCPTSISEMQN